MALLDAYWAAAKALDPVGAGALDDDQNPWCTRAGLRALWREAGLECVETAELSAGAPYDDVDDAWFSFAAGAGVSGSYGRSLDADHRKALREEFRRRLNMPDSPFRLEARVWAVRGQVT
jgi:hypothetical protein